LIGSVVEWRARSAIVVVVTRNKVLRVEWLGCWLHDEVLVLKLVSLEGGVVGWG